MGIKNQAARLIFEILKLAANLINLLTYAITRIIKDNLPRMERMVIKLLHIKNESAVIMINSVVRMRRYSFPIFLIIKVGHALRAKILFKKQITKCLLISHWSITTHQIPQPEAI